MTRAFEVCCFLFIISSQCKTVFSAQCTEPDCSKAKFSYDRGSCLGPVNWSGITPCWSQCGGNRQSPINIRRADATYSNTGSFTFNIGDQQAFQVTSSNQGFKTSFKVTEENDIILSNVNQFGQGGNSFRLVGFHFHAGKFDNSTGSEHSFDGEFQPIEQHMVFYNTKYSDVKTASTHSDGLLVIGVMIQTNAGVSLTPDCEQTFQSTLSNVLENSFDELEDYLVLDESEESEESLVYESLTLRDLLPSDKESYYTYEGSLTTPPCSETVTWIVMKCPITVSQAVVEEFKNLEISYSEEELGVHGNRRPVQRGQQSTTFTLLKNF